MDVAEVRRRIRAALTQARQDAQARRARLDDAARAYDAFLQDTAAPLFRTVAGALAGEGFRFVVSTPAGSVRLSPEGSPDSYIELELDASGDDAQVIGRSSRGRGRRQVTAETPIAAGARISAISEEDLLGYLVGELPPFLVK